MYRNDEADLSGEREKKRIIFLETLYEHFAERKKIKSMISEFKREKVDDKNINMIIT